MNIFQLIERDHRAIESLLCRLERPPGRADFDQSGRDYLRDRLVSCASRHEAAEEMAFWPDVRRRLPDGGLLADHALQQERDAKAVLELLGLARSEEEIAETSRQLRQLVQRHAWFEEATVFPEMRRRTTVVWTRLAALRYRAADRTGPTRPHSRGPDRPLGLLTVGAPAVLLDHARDLGSRRRRHPTGFEHPERPDAIAVITRDHRQIATLLTEIEAAEDPDDSLVHTAIRELAIHDAIERQHLYPAIRYRLTDGDRRYAQLLSEHAKISGLAADLDAYRFHDEARESWVRNLVVDVRTHFEQEEAAVLPAMRARMTHEELVDLGDLLASARATAPTRPHLHLAGAGMGARLSRLMTVPLDKARDVVRGRLAEKVETGDGWVGARRSRRIPMTDPKKQPRDTSQSEQEEEDRLTNQPGDVNEGHDEAALEEASERMLLRKDRT